MGSAHQRTGQSAATGRLRHIVRREFSLVALVHQIVIAYRATPAAHPRAKGAATSPLTQSLGGRRAAPVPATSQARCGAGRQDFPEARPRTSPSESQDVSAPECADPVAASAEAQVGELPWRRRRRSSRKLKQMSDSALVITDDQTKTCCFLRATW
jgi:hypothetical protein